FTMRGYITICGADMIGRTKLMKTLGNRAYSYCEYCYARGIWNGSIYCPFDLPTDPSEEAKRRDDFETWKAIDRYNLELRKHQESVQIAEHIVDKMCSKCSAKHGLRGKSILLYLRSIDFPRSFPPDEMHLMSENIIPAMFRHYRDKLAKFVRTDEPWNVPPSVWDDIGKAFLASAKTYPYAFGDPLRNFKTHCHELKAAEWITVIKLAPIFLRNTLELVDYEGLVNLADICLEMQKRKYDQDQYTHLRDSIVKFSKYYES
ncbi:hypothetical protein EDC01DRAFT_598147, partial [Geopyxis carbonaria]